MYLAAVALLMFLLPALSVVTDSTGTDDVEFLALVGKWFVFWAIGVRLFTAGIRQVLRPGLTAEDILGIDDPESWVLVRELGFANVATGLAGILTLWFDDWRPAVAVVGGLFLLLAGIAHIPRDRNLEENVAMVSDLWVGAVMAVYLASLL